MQPQSEVTYTVNCEACGKDFESSQHEERKASNDHTIVHVWGTCPYCDEAAQTTYDSDDLPF